MSYPYDTEGDEELEDVALAQKVYDLLYHKKIMKVINGKIASVSWKSSNLAGLPRMSFTELDIMTIVKVSGFIGVHLS